MIPMEESWTVSYDVSTNARRRPLATALAAHGRRDLYSVFEVTVSRPRIAHLLAVATSQLDHGDCLLAVRHCPDCEMASSGAPLEATPCAWIVA